MKDTEKAFLNKYNFSTKYFPTPHLMSVGDIQSMKVNYSENIASGKELSCAYTPKVKTSSTTNTDEKSYGCTQCEFRSTTQSNLNRHMLTHSGEKPFSCAVCGYRCKQKGTLSVHMKR